MYCNGQFGLRAMAMTAELSKSGSTPNSKLKPLIAPLPVPERPGIGLSEQRYALQQSSHRAYPTVI